MSAVQPTCLACESSERIVVHFGRRYGTFRISSWEAGLLTADQT